MNWIIKQIVLKLADWCEKTGRLHVITGGPKDETAYLARYILFKSKYGCIYIHRFLRSDADHPHDHPWNFFTYVISGGYDEWYYDVERPERSPDMKEYYSYWTTEINKRQPGSLAYRKATDIHKVVLNRSYTLDEIKEAPFTICFMGPRLRHWGFWNLEEKGAVWTDWRKYLNITPDDPRIEGSE